MKRFAWLTLPVLALVALALHAPVQGQAGPQIGIDADTSGNSAEELGATDDCGSLEVDGTLDVDIVIRDVEELLAWQGIITYDDDVIEIVDADVDLFMGANAGSDVQSVVGELPDSNGFLEVGAFDSSDPPMVNSGSGVLARLTVRAIAEGTTELAFSALDIDNDTVQDDGLILRDVDNGYIGDSDGDLFFDGPTSSAIVAVGTTCDNLPAETTPAADNGEGNGSGDDDDGGTSTLTIIAIAAGVVIVAVAGAGLLIAARRRSST